jgi:Trk-type K+ transport system membrane component
MALVSFFRKFAALTTAELSVLSFVFMSFVGGAVLYGTEYHREVEIRVPMHQEVKISKTGSVVDVSALPVDDRTEVHTVTIAKKQQGESFVDALFTAVSALCVTGLTSTDFSHFSLTGQIVVLLLIQMGGLGIIVFTSIFAFTVFRGVSDRLSFKKMLAGIVDTEHHYVARMIKHVATYTAFIEITAALVMGARLAWFVDPATYNNINPWWWGVFHSVSAFNNAGFGLMNSNLVSFLKDPVINLTIMALIVLGGLGYPVLIAFHAAVMSRYQKATGYSDKLYKEDAALVASSVQIRIALWGTVGLIVLGALVPLLIETNNPALGGDFWTRLLSAAFQSVSTRTAGFNTIDIGALHVSTLFLYMVLMFIGANPAGTAGGIKIPTIATLYGYVKDWFAAPGLPVMLFKQRLSKFAVSHAIRLFFFSIMFVFVSVFLITVFEREWLITPDPTMNFVKVMFETFSAFGTVGLSMGFAGGVTSLSALFSGASKIVVIVAMLAGRLGPLTLLAALPWKRRYMDAEQSSDFEDAVKLQIG